MDGDATLRAVAHGIAADANARRRDEHLLQVQQWYPLAQLAFDGDA
jgi:hypothetical protein